MIRYDKGRSGIKWRTLSLKQWAEWVVTHPILQRMDKLMENMSVENKNAILGNHTTSVNSTDLIETTEALINFQKQRGGNEKAGNWYGEIDSHANPLTLPQDSPLQSVVNGSTASKNVNSHNYIVIGTKLPQRLYTSIKRCWRRESN